MFLYIIITFPSLLGKVPMIYHLITLLDPIKNMWNIIGLKLQVQHADIKSIKLEPCDVCTKLSEVLQLWIDGKTCEVSWRMIITVIKNPPVTNKGVADSIYKFLARPEIKNEYLTSDKHGNLK